MKQWEITIKGTGFLNGPVSINKTFLMDEVQAKAFNGTYRYEALEAYVQANYPGLKINPRQFGIGVNPNPESVKKKITKVKRENFLTGAMAGAVIGTFLKNNNTSNSEEIEETESFSDRIKEQLNFTFSNDTEILKSQLEKLLMLAAGYNWSSSDTKISKSNNQALNQLLTKTSFGLKMLKKGEPNPELYAVYQQSYKKLFFRKIIQKHGYIILGLILLIVIFSILGIREL